MAAATKRRSHKHCDFDKQKAGEPLRFERVGEPNSWRIALRGKRPRRLGHSQSVILLFESVDFSPVAKELCSQEWQARPMSHSNECTIPCRAVYFLCHPNAGLDPTQFADLTGRDSVQFYLTKSYSRIEVEGSVSLDLQASGVGCLCRCEHVTRQGTHHSDKADMCLSPLAIMNSQYLKSLEFIELEVIYVGRPPPPRAVNYFCGYLWIYRNPPMKWLTLIFSVFRLFVRSELINFEFLDVSDFIDLTLFLEGFSAGFGVVFEVGDGVVRDGVVKKSYRDF